MVGEIAFCGALVVFSSFLHKIWVQGKNYGYEFPIPSDIRRREMERNAPAAVVAQYTQQQETTQTVAQTEAPKEEVKAEERTEVAQATPPPAPAPEAAPEPAPVVREQAEQAPAPAEMPHTAGNWLNLALGGSLLAASGLALRRVRA